MGELLRRREMVQAIGGGSEWDIDWDYTMGVLPTARGWTRTDASGSNATQTLRSTDVRIYVKNSSNNIVYASGTNNSIGSVELEFEFTNNYGTLLLFISDGESYAFGIRAQYNSNYKGIYLFDDSSVASMTKVQAIARDTYYKIRLETDGTYGYVYVNDILMADKVDLSTMINTNYTTRCTVTATSPSYASYTNLKSLRLKLGRL